MNMGKLTSLDLSFTNCTVILRIALLIKVIFEDYVIIVNTLA